jgi:hypothetical protein
VTHLFNGKSSKLERRRRVLSIQVLACFQPIIIEKTIRVKLFGGLMDLYISN